MNFPFPAAVTAGAAPPRVPVKVWRLPEVCGRIEREERKGLGMAGFEEGEGGRDGEGDARTNGGGSGGGGCEEGVVEKRRRVSGRRKGRRRYSGLTGSSSGWITNEREERNRQFRRRVETGLTRAREKTHQQQQWKRQW